MLETERRAVAERVGALAERTPGRTGNLSVRRDDRMAITPTGVAYDAIGPEDVAVVGIDGDRLTGPEPSSEAPMHAGVYRRLDAGAVVHTHSPWATTLAALREPVPPVHYVLASAGGRVPVAEYATYGTEALAANAVAALTDAGTTACLLANHGLLALGDDLDGAMETADHVEFTARTYARAAAIGEPVELPDEEIDRVGERFEGYGQRE